MRFARTSGSGQRTRKFGVFERRAFRQRVFEWRAFR